MIRYDVAQICTSGHPITLYANTSPNETEKFCRRCGAATITACPKCGTNIQGGVLQDYPSFLKDYTPPRHCPNCGEPFPWTEARLAEARELAVEQATLTEAERSELADSIDSLVQQTPDLPQATVRFKRLMEKIGREGASAFRDILVDILSEAVKKSVFPP